MNIAIIGTGNVGTGLAVALSATHHGVVLGARTAQGGKEAAARLEREHRIRVQGADVPTAVGLADVVFLAVPFEAAGSLADAADFAGKIVVDVTNPLTEDYSGLSIGHTTSAAEEIARLVPGAAVVKAFNTVFAQVYTTGLDFGGRRIPVYVAADDADAKASVSRLATEAGFDPVDAGPLTNARLLEPLAAMNIQFGYALGHGTDITPAWLHR